MNTNLGVDKIIYTAKFYDGLNTSQADIPFYLKYAKKAKKDVLELCCGTGRITIPLAKAGINITGVDIEPTMLSAAIQKANEEGLTTKFVKADMRKLKLSKKFDLIFIPFNSLQHTYSYQDVEKVFTGIKKHLRPGGTFLFDVFNPSIEYMVQMKSPQHNKYNYSLKDGPQVIIDEVCSYDSARQTNCVTWTYHVAGDEPIAAKLDMRCFYPLEMDALLHYNGFKVLKKFGGFDESPFNRDSKKQIYICKLN